VLVLGAGFGGQRPVGCPEGPATALGADKSAFGTDRIRRWFGHDWFATT